MLKLLFYLPLALFCSAKFNPGLVAKFPKKSLIQVAQMALPVINPLISHMEIDQRFEMSIITLKGFDIDFQPLLESQVEWDFDSDPASIGTSVFGLKFSFRSPCDVKVWVFQSKGWIRAEGRVEVVKFSTTGLPFDDKYAGKPYVRLRFHDIGLNPENINIRADIDWVPDFVMDQLLKFIKSTVVGNIRQALIDWLNVQLTPNINDRIREVYPADLRIGDMDCSLQTALTDPIFLDKENIYFSLDGTIFVTAKGYRRSEDAPRIAFGETGSRFLDFYLTDYSLRTFLQSIARLPYIFRITDFSAGIISQDEKVSLSVSEAGVAFRRFNSWGKITWAQNFVEMNSTLSATIRPWITREKDEFVLNLGVNDFKVDNKTLKSNYQTLEDSADAIQAALELYWLAEPNCSMPLPDIDIFGYKWKDWGISSRDGHLRLGINI